VNASGGSPAHVAALDPDRVAQVMSADGSTLTYGELDTRSRRLARVFREYGLGLGDHVAIVTGNHEMTLTVCWAAQRSGLFWTPINTRWTPTEMSHVLRDSDARAVIASAQFAPLVESALADLDGERLRVSVDETVGSFQGLESVWSRVDEGPLEGEREGVEMLYSSGTTGRPKGVVPGPVGAPFGTSDATFDSLRRHYGIDRDTVFVAATPLFHIAALASALVAQRVGGCVVVMDRFESTAFLRAVEEHRGTHTMLVPTLMSRLLELPEEVRASYGLESLRFVGHGGAPCPPSVKEKVLNWLGPIVYDCWGATERPGLTMIAPEEWPERRGSVGRPISGIIHVLDATEREVPARTVGQVYWETERPFEYHGDPEKTAASRSSQGWCTVGDLGYVDEDGYLYLTDRASFLIITGGENVYPVEVENVLIEHPGVRDVAVLGRDHADLGQQVVAYVEPTDADADPDELAADIIGFARGRLAGYKCPRRVELRSSIPRTATGKLLKREIE
jgi:long-chain acyl-CoA synthetase